MEQAESRWPTVSAMFGMGGYEVNFERKTGESGSGYPTLVDLQANSSSAGLSAAPTLATTAGFANAKTPSSVDSRGVNPMAASAQTTVPASTGQVSLQDLRKAQIYIGTKLSKRLTIITGNGHRSLAQTEQSMSQRILLGVVNAIETDLAQPKTLTECMNKVRTYLQDCQIAINMLNSIGGSKNVELSTSRVYNALACFIHHVSCLDTVLTTRIELLGQVTDNDTLPALFTWATKVLGLVAERVREDKQFKALQQGNSKPTNPNKPSANSAERASNKNPKGDKPKPAANAADGTPKPPKGKGKGEGKKGREPSNPPKGEGRGAKDAGKGSKDNKTLKNHSM
eukprot:155550-Amphidinium_carterae.1